MCTNSRTQKHIMSRTLKTLIQKIHWRGTAPPTPFLPHGLNHNHTQNVQIIQSPRMEYKTTATGEKKEHELGILVAGSLQSDVFGHQERSSGLHYKKAQSGYNHHHWTTLSARLGAVCVLIQALLLSLQLPQGAVQMLTQWTPTPVLNYYSLDLQPSVLKLLQSSRIDQWDEHCLSLAQKTESHTEVSLSSAFITEVAYSDWQPTSLCNSYY